MLGAVNTKKREAVGSVRLEGVSKQFKLSSQRQKGYTTLKSDLLRWLRGRASSDSEASIKSVEVLQNVSFEVNPGSSTGVIGRNGSGKSTLLKLISGIYRPNSGQVKVSGKVSALIELGAGFHPDFTGRENVYLGGVMYGLSRKEIDQRLQQIVEYAELEDVIDEPVRTYSSGMYMRLGFSLAIHTDPDLLLVDEVLSVGDAAFVSRCQETLNEFRRLGKTLLIVTHDLSSVVRWCDQVIWLDGGKIRLQGEPHYVVDSYLAAIEDQQEKRLATANLGSIDGKAEKTQDLSSGEEVKRWGSREVEITEVAMFDQQQHQHWVFSSEHSARIEVTYKVNETVDELVCGVGVLSAAGDVIFGTNTDIESIDVPVPQAGQQAKFVLELERLGLTTGSYYLDVAIHRQDGSAYDYHHLLYKFQVDTRVRSLGLLRPKQSWSFVG